MPWKQIEGKFDMIIGSEPYREVQVMNSKNLENLWAVLEIQKFILIKTKNSEKILVPTNRIIEVRQSEEYWCDECGIEKLTWSDCEHEDGLCSKCRKKLHKR